jgi:hypothetical protein
MWSEVDRFVIQTVVIYALDEQVSGVEKLSGQNGKTSIDTNVGRRPLQDLDTLQNRSLIR